MRAGYCNLGVVSSSPVKMEKFVLQNFHCFIPSNNKLTTIIYTFQKCVFFSSDFKHFLKCIN